MERKPWTQSEDQALKSIVSQIGLTNWTLVSAKLSKACPESDRAGKQCRQRWLNHLDLSVSKKPWTKGEDKALFQLHNMNGNRWKEISKHLKTRTQNDIKNHFYATMRKGIRRLNKLLGFKIEISRIRKIKPIILSKLCQEQSQTANSNQNKFQIQGVFNLLLKLSRAQPPPEQSDELLQNQKLIVKASQFLDKLVLQNENYEQLKLTKNSRKISRGSEMGEYKSEELNVEVDISEYLCLGQEFDEMEQIRPKSQGASIKVSEMKSEYNGSFQQEINREDQQNI